MIRKEIGIGFLTGLIANSMGIAICIVIISMIRGMGFEDTFWFYWQTESMWMIVSLGALPNLAVFFGFLRINREYRARGVLIATFLAAIITYIIYFS